MDIWGHASIAQLWEVFLLFAIPVGGGIPAGVVLARKHGVGWLDMSLLYFISDVALAVLFEPCLIALNWIARYNKVLTKMILIVREGTRRTIARYGAKPGPLMLIAISFGVDPMTGRAAALAAGHNFMSGWLVAIIGDMLFFGLIAISTIFLHDALGDGTWAAVIVMVAMLVIPTVINRVRSRQNRDFGVKPESSPKAPPRNEP